MAQIRTIRERTDDALHYWRVAMAVMGFIAFLATGWTQFVGPGVRPVSQEFLGITEINERLDWVEEFMPAPAVVEWNLGASFQLGPCFPNDVCGYALAGSRTEYGDSCGKPLSVVPFIRLSDGRLHQSEFPNWGPVELSRAQTAFTVPLYVPPVIPRGTHQFRVRVLYPSCPGRNEPIPRWTPWFPLEITGRPPPSAPPLPSDP